MEIDEASSCAGSTFVAVSDTGTLRNREKKTRNIMMMMMAMMASATVACRYFIVLLINKFK